MIQWKYISIQKYFVETNKTRNEQKMWFSNKFHSNNGGINQFLRTKFKYMKLCVYYTIFDNNNNNHFICFNKNYNK